MSSQAGSGTNFGGLPPEHSSYNSSAIVILPVPFDLTGTWIRGAEKGPEAILRASANMELYDIETGTEVYKQGIHTAEPVISENSDDMVRQVRKKVTKLLSDNKFTVVAGGEHTVALGSMMAHSSHYRDLTIVHLDAHTDMRDEYEYNRLSHACVMARVSEFNPRIISAGIRSMDYSEAEGIKDRHIFHASYIHKSNDWVRRIIELSGNNVYLTIDLDVLDPAVMPSTGTPEPGGLGWYDLMGLFEALSSKRNIVGFDVVELCPSQGRVDPDFLAAKLIYQLLSMKFAASPENN